MTRPLVSKAEHTTVLIIHQNIVKQSEKMLRHYQEKEILTKGCALCELGCTKCPWEVYEAEFCESWTEEYFGIYNINHLRRGMYPETIQQDWAVLRIKMLKQWISKSKKQIKYREKKIEGIL